MKILNITAQKPYSTGSGTYLRELMKAFDEMGHDQALVCGISSSEEVSRIFELNTNIYPVIYNSEEIPYEILGMSDEMPYPSTKYRNLKESDLHCFKKVYLEKISTAVSDFNPDIIICHHLYLLTGIIADYFKGHGVVGICHGTCLRQLSSHDMNNDVIINSLKQLDKIYALHDAQKQEIQSLLGEDVSNKLEVIGTGYNPDIFKINSNNLVSRSCDRILNIIYAGKISRKKGLVQLINGLSRLSADEIGKDKIVLRLAGGTGSLEDKNEIETAIASCPHSVELLGELNHYELSEVFNQSDVFILPSFYEGLPLVLIEALACGLPVVASNTPGLKNWIECNIKKAPIQYIELPSIVNADEPLVYELYDFETRIVDALKKVLIINSEFKDCNLKIDMSKCTWEYVAKKILE
ncbi:MAG: glycosyltransferase family 4 protein [Proteocatella sp.]